MIKILIAPSDHHGVGHFRSIWPAQVIRQEFGDKISVEINLDVDTNNINYLKGFDIIHFHRTLGPYENMKNLMKILRSEGVITIMDIDDYWVPPTTHPLYSLVMQEGMNHKISDNIDIVDYVTTTTDVFADYIRKKNPNVKVLPNALNLKDRMWNSTVKENPNDFCRVSWIGGSSHFYDLKLLEESMMKLGNSSELKDKLQLIVCGFDTRGSVTEILPNGEKRNRMIEPKESIWNDFERIFTNNYRSINDKEYAKWLQEVKNEDYPNMYDKNFIRRWTLPLTKYGYHYDYCDVCLAPLEHTETYKEIKNEKGELEHVPVTDYRPGTIKTRVNIFNEVKSELKIIEAGFKKKVLIAQDFGIYSKIIKDGENGILIKPEDNKKGWYKAIKEVATNKELREKLANNLHEYVLENYDLKKLTEKRVSFYEYLVQNKEYVQRHQNSKSNNQIVLKDILQKSNTSNIDRIYPVNTEVDLKQIINKVAADFKIDEPIKTATSKNKKK